MPSVRFATDIKGTTHVVDGDLELWGSAFENSFEVFTASLKHAHEVRKKTGFVGTISVHNDYLGCTYHHNEGDI